MKIRNFLSFFSLALLALAPLSSCDSVEEPDRYIPVEKDEAKRNVLMWEFTGQLCTNCPDGHEAIHNLLGLYPDSFIPVSITATGNDLAWPEPVGLGIPEGADYYKFAGSPALPAATFDMKTAPLFVENWASTLVSLVTEETSLDMNVEAFLSDNDQSISIGVNMIDAYGVSGKLLVWVLENDIVAYQLDHGKHILDYVHNHVLRAVVNGTWGQEVNLAPGKETTVNLSQTVKSNWNTANLQIVAFVYNDGGVVQAVQCDVK